MKNFKLIIYLIAFLLLTGQILNAKNNDSAGQAGAFLRIPVSARAAGMGNAFASIAEDANALYFNPAGLYQNSQYTFSAMYALMSMDRRHFQGSFIYNNESFGAFGLMFTGFGVSDIDGRDNLGNPTEKFADNEMALSLCYGSKLFSFISFGVGFKYLYHTLHENSATGMGFDAGLLTTFEMEDGLLKKLRFGLSASNYNARLKWDTASSHEDEIPLTARGGASADLELSKMKVIFALEGSHTLNENLKLHAGAETWFFNVLGIRGGMYGSDFNYGASIKVMGVRIDYAYCPDVLEQGATERIGLHLEF